MDIRSSGVLAAFLVLLFTIPVVPLPSVGASPVASTISDPSFSQTFSINPSPGTYGSNRNYVLEDNGTALQNFASTVTPSGFLNGVSNPTSSFENFTIQMNAFNPTGYGADTMQYVVFIDVASTTVGFASLQIGLEVEYFAQGGLRYSTAPAPSTILESSFKGAAVTISTVTSSNGAVTSASASMTLLNGTVKSIGSISIAAADQFPAVAYETDIVGFGGGNTATFTQASGTISYSSSGPMGFSSAVGPIGLSYTASRANYGTNEQSNLGYSSLTSTAPAAPTPCQNCQSTTTTQVVPYSPKPGQFAQDLGLFNTSTSLMGFSWSAQQGQSLSMGLPSGCQPSAIQFNASLTMLQCPNLNLFFKPEGYQSSLIIQGTGPGTVCFPLTAMGASINFNATGNPFSVVAGANVFDFSDIPASYSPSFNAQTNQVCYNAPAGSYTIDPLAIDGSNKNGTNGATSLTCTLTTANTNDLVFAFFTIFAENSHAFTGISDGASLSWAARVSALTGQTGEGYSYEYWAKSSGTLTGDVITVTVASSTFIGIICWGVSGASTASNPFDPNVGLPFTNTGTSGTTYSVTWSTTNNADFVMNLAGNSNVALGISSWGWGSGTSNRISDSSLSGSGVDAYGQWNVTAIKHTSVSATMTCSSCNAPWQTIVDAVCSSAGCSTGTASQGIKITTANGATSATITITGCSPSNSTFTANGNTHTYTLTASCTVTLTEPSDGTNTRYRFNVSPKPTAATSITFSTCSSGTCSVYSNTTYFQLGENYSATPKTPWDGTYSGLVTGTGGHLIGTFLGLANTAQACQNNLAGTTITYCLGHGAGFSYFDYNTAVGYSTPIGNSWFAQGNNSFIDTTGGHAHNVPFAQATSGGINFNWLLLLPFGLLIFVVILGRKKL